MLQGWYVQRRPPPPGHTVGRRMPAQSERREPDNTQRATPSTPASSSSAGSCMPVSSVVVHSWQGRWVAALATLGARAVVVGRQWCVVLTGG